MVLPAGILICIVCPLLSTCPALFFQFRAILGSTAETSPSMFKGDCCLPCEQEMYSSFSRPQLDGPVRPSYPQCSTGSFGFASSSACARWLQKEPAPTQSMVFRKQRRFIANTLTVRNNFQLNNFNVGANICRDCNQYTSCRKNCRATKKAGSISRLLCFTI